MSTKSLAVSTKQVILNQIQQQMLMRTEMIRNEMTMRRQWMEKFFDPRRDLDEECGYPESVDATHYMKLFKRGDLASRVISILPKECWSDNPLIFETEEEDLTPFEEAWKELDLEFSVLSVLHRADILSGIGRFGVVLLGVDDGLDLAQPIPGIDARGQKVVTPGASTTPTRKLLYLRPFDETLVKVSQFEADKTNPRYGLPVQYDIQMSDENDPIQDKTTIKVHWSRLIHLADNRISSDVYGQPRMEVVLNRLLDIRKIAGGSAEMFWKGGFPGVSLETQPGMELENVDFDVDATKAQLEKYQNGLQRYLATIGMTAKSLATQVADPSPHLETQIRLIAMALEVPWRVFMGSEAAQLASEQDMKSWNKRLNRRREGYLSPFVLRPTIQRLINIDILPQPDELHVDWLDLNIPSDKDKADAAERRSNALAKYVEKGIDLVMAPFHYLTLVHGYTDDEARAIIQDAGGDVSIESALEDERDANRPPARLPAPGGGNGRPAPARQ